MLLKIYKALLRLKGRRKLNIFRRVSTLGTNVTIGHSSNAFVAPNGKLTIGDNCEINAVITVKSGASVSIGNNTTIRMATIGALESIIIGNYVIISSNVTIYDNNNHPTSEKKRKAMSESGFYSPLWNWSESEHAPIVIEDNVWIGQNCAILKGVTIGRGSVVAMNSIVTKSVPPHSIVAGNPAQVVKSIPESERVTQ